MGRWVANDYRGQFPRKLTEKTFQQRFRDAIHRHNIVTDPQGDTFVKGRFDEARFAGRFAQARLAMPTAEIMQHYFESIYESLLGKPPAPELRFVEKSVDHAEFAIEMALKFPRAKFIHIVRNPYSNMVSLRKYKSIDFGFPLIFRIIRTFQNSFYFLYKNRRLIDPARYHVIRYEDILRDVEKEMRGVADFLGIDFTPSLLRPTLLGEHWGGNSTTGKQFKGINAANIDRWKGGILPMEIYFVNRLFRHVLDDYGYEKLEYTGGYWRKGKGENLKRWMANRMYRYYLRP